MIVTRCFTQHRKYCCWVVTKNASGLVQTKNYCWTNALGLFRTNVVKSHQSYH